MAVLNMAEVSSSPSQFRNVCHLRVERWPYHLVLGIAHHQDGRNKKPKDEQKFRDDVEDQTLIFEPSEVQQLIPLFHHSGVGRRGSNV